eukprot:m.9741 g.9741  ORF g.9741 m.9741 type:complete len:391 (+) comp21600_c0_seq2:49-1221(+)
MAETDRPKEIIRLSTGPVTMEKVKRAKELEKLEMASGRREAARVIGLSKEEEEECRATSWEFGAVKTKVDDVEEESERPVASATSIYRQVTGDEEMARQLQEEDEVRRRGIPQSDEEMARQLQEQYDRSVVHQIQRSLSRDSSRGEFHVEHLFSPISIIKDRDLHREERRRQQRLREQEKRQQFERRQRRVFRRLLSDSGWNAEDFGGSSPNSAYRNFRAELQSQIGSELARDRRDPVETDSSEFHFNEIAGDVDINPNPWEAVEEIDTPFQRHAPPGQPQFSQLPRPQGFMMGGLPSPLVYEDLLQIEDMLGQFARGADQLTIDDHSSVGKFTASSAGENRQCAICMTDFEEGEDIRRLPCLHPYHVKCIDRWLKTNRICPVCRIRIDE